MPLRAQSFRFSDDGRKLLLFTNTARVWRANTRGDYWVLDLGTGALRKLGGPAAKPQTLMFAKFSPQGDRVAYVRENNIYVERLSDGSDHPAHHGTARAPRSTAPSTGCTRKNSTTATASAGARTARGSPTGSSTHPACAISC